MNYSFFDEMHKIAEEVREHPAATIAKGVGGATIGGGLAYGAAHYGDKAIRAATGGKHGIPPGAVAVGAPIIGAGAGLGAGLLHNKMIQRMTAQPHLKEQEGEPESTPA
jgi:hypothetical protein